MKDETILMVYSPSQAERKENGELRDRLIQQDAAKRKDKSYANSRHNRNKDQSCRIPREAAEYIGKHRPDEQDKIRRLGRAAKNGTDRTPYRGGKAVSYVSFSLLASLASSAAAHASSAAARPRCASAGATWTVPSRGAGAARLRQARQATWTHWTCSTAGER